MLLQQVLEELSSSPAMVASAVVKEKEKGRGIEANDPLPYHKQQRDPKEIFDSIHANRQRANDNHTNRNVVAAPIDPATPTSVAKSSAPTTRYTSSTNAQYLYRAAVTAKEIQVSGHGRISAPALLANCLLSMISLSDDEDDGSTAKIENNPPPVEDEESRSTILKSFSQLRAEERNGKDAYNHGLHTDHHQKLEVVTCCLFPCSKRNITFKSMGSTLGLLNHSDDLSSSNDDSNSRCKARVHGDRGGALRNLVKKVLCKGSSDAGTGSSIGDHEIVFDERWAAGTPLSIQSHLHQDECDMNINERVDGMYDCEYMYTSAYGDLSYAGKPYAGVKKKACVSEIDGGVAQEVVHEVISLSHDTPIASSFVFGGSCFSPSSSTSSMTHCIKLESTHPWLASGADLDSCTTSPQHRPPGNRLLQGVMQDDLQYRLANKRLNLSR